mmetsp:Transcript_10102/g.19372  ORF Transcript_10102/g.19372 Transcript_10102/m.19372 type:complete len:258 (-) Transcript_10102:910-1683(-)
MAASRCAVSTPGNPRPTLCAHRLNPGRSTHNGAVHIGGRRFPHDMGALRLSHGPHLRPAGDTDAHVELRARAAPRDPLSNARIDPAALVRPRDDPLRVRAQSKVVGGPLRSVDVRAHPHLHLHGAELRGHGCHRTAVQLRALLSADPAFCDKHDGGASVGRQQRHREAPFHARCRVPRCTWSADNGPHPVDQLGGRKDELGPGLRGRAASRVFQRFSLLRVYAVRQCRPELGASPAHLDRQRGQRFRRGPGRDARSQ